MTNATTERNLAAENARAKLRDLARCTAITPFQAGDEETLCGSCLIPIERVGGTWRHDPNTINRLRNATYDGRWPNGD